MTQPKERNKRRLLILCPQKLLQTSFVAFHHCLFRNCCLHPWLFVEKKCSEKLLHASLVAVHQLITARCAFPLASNNENKLKSKARTTTHVAFDQVKEWPKRSFQQFLVITVIIKRVGQPRDRISPGLLIPPQLAATPHSSRLQLQRVQIFRSRIY